LRDEQGESFSYFTELILIIENLKSDPEEKGREKVRGEEKNSLSIQSPDCFLLYV